METFAAFATVLPQGDVRVVGVPFAPGTEVEVIICPKRKSAADFQEAWRRVTAELRRLPAADKISDQDIQQEIADFRAGR